jgi:site-specific recombinase XerD
MAMDTTVTGIASVVVEELRAVGYMESTIGQYEKTIKALTRFVEERGRTYTPSLGAAFASMTVSPRTGRFSAQRRFDYGRLVNVFDTYVRTGCVDLSCRKRGGGGARPDSSEFTALAAAWEAEMDDRGLAPATRDAYGRVSRSYLVFLESRGIRCLAGADGASVLGFLESASSRWATSSLFWVVSNFRPFLKFTGRAEIVQQKTNNPLTVPLTDLLIGRLADYVLDQRPDSDDDHVFLRSVAPHARLADHASIYRVITDVFGKAGLTDVKAGSRLLRHNAASRLLRAAVPLPTISAVLGHASPESTNLYMSADHDRLLECVLDVPEDVRS